MANPDPKPGRWILPLVVLALVATTYWFVDALPPATSPAAAGGGSGALTDTTLAGPTAAVTTTQALDATTTTTLLPQVAAFLDRVADVGTRADQLGADARTINDAWDARTAGLSEIQAELDRIESETIALADEVQAETPPDVVAGAWSGVALAAGDMETAAAGMITGLASSDDGTIRRNALTAFEEAVAAVNVALDLVNDRARS